MSRLAPDKRGACVARASSLKLDRKSFWDSQDDQQLPQHQQPRQQPPQATTASTNVSPGKNNYSLRLKQRRGLMRRSGSFGAATLRDNFGASSSSSFGPGLPLSHSSNALRSSSTSTAVSSRNWALSSSSSHGATTSTSSPIRPNATKTTRREAGGKSSRHLSTGCFDSCMPAASPQLPLARSNTKWHKIQQQRNGNSRCYRLALFMFALTVGLGGCILSIRRGLATAAENIEENNRNGDRKTKSRTRSNSQQQPSTSASKTASASKSSTTNTNGLRNANVSYKSQLRRKMADILLSRGVTTQDRLEDPFSPAYAALQWLVDSSLGAKAWTLTDHEIITRFALATLFYATHAIGSVWTHEKNWVHATIDSSSGQAPAAAAAVHVCDWYGIECRTKNAPDDLLGQPTEVVTHIRLGHNQLQGTLPGELFQGLAKDLLVLDLSHNQLWGPLALPLSSSLNSNKGRPLQHQLQRLRLNHNAMTGDIPDSLAGSHIALPHLKEIKLDHNHFDNAEQLGFLVNPDKGDGGGDGGGDEGTKLGGI